MSDNIYYFFRNTNLVFLRRSNNCSNRFYLDPFINANIIPFHNIWLNLVLRIKYNFALNETDQGEQYKQNTSN